MKKESLAAAKAAYEIEYECLREMVNHFDEDAFVSAHRAADIRAFSVSISRT